MADLQVDRVTTDGDLRQFITLPWEVYRGDPYWVPPPLSERRDFYNREKNPFFLHSQVEYFVARRGKQPVGTIAAILNENHNRFHKERIGFFGIFEVMDDPEAASALLQTAEEWARAKGLTALRGPTNFSSNDEWGMLVEGFDAPPVILMPYNPRRYVGYVEQAGFTKAMDLLSYDTPRSKLVREALPPKLLRVVDKLPKRHNVRLRTLNMKRLEEETVLLMDIYHRAWSENWGFVPMTEAEIVRLAKNLAQFVDPDLVFIAEVDGQAVGFSLALPDLNEPLKLAYPTPQTPEPLTMAKLIWHWKIRSKVKCLRMFGMGLLPEYRNTGIDSLFYVETARVGVAKGLQRADFSWALENNLKINQILTFMGGTLYKRHRIWEKSLT